MLNELIVHNTIRIHASPERVWQVLTHGEETRKYMYGCTAISDWRPGSTLLWKGVFDGVETVAVSGRVVDIEQGKFLSYTAFDPNAGLEDIPANHTTVTYNLAGDEGYTVLTVTQGDYAKVPDGKRKYDEAVMAGGWGPILEEIRKIAEKEPA